MRSRVALAAAAALFIVVVPGAIAVPPIVEGDPSIGLVVGSQVKPIPPEVPHVGDTLESTWATFHCDPSCDPNNPDSDPTVGNREVHPSGYGPPAGIKLEWERCDTPNATGCVVVQPRSSDQAAARYVVKDTDAGRFLRSAVYATNLDCGYPRSYDQHQDCAWQTRGVYSHLVGIPALPAVEFAPTSLPDGVAGTPYATVTFAPTFGTPPHTFTVIGGALPPGVTLSAAGVLSGTPTTGGTFVFTIRASATSGASPSQRTYTVHIALALGPATLPAGTTGVPYTTPLTATGATAPITWSVQSGTLPPGLAIDANGSLAGTPTAKGTFTFTVQAIDKNGAGGSALYSVEIGFPTLKAASARLPQATVGKRYREFIIVSGGSEPYRFQLAQGTLPTGLKLGPAGALVGTPKGRAGTFRFGVLVTDRYGAQGTFTITITVKAAPKKKPAKHA